jgi:hypothetical protein
MCAAGGRVAQDFTGLCPEQDLSPLPGSHRLEAVEHSFEESRTLVPAPQAAMMKELAKLQFRAAGLSLPGNWQQPSGETKARQYLDAFKPDELATAPIPMPPALFLAATINKYHTGTAKEISDGFQTYIEGICDAICSAWSQWQSAAVLLGVVINAVTAAGGQVVGPPLAPLIMASAPKSTPQELKYSNAIAQAIGIGWTAYTATIKVPGLPWYPAFAAFPAPVAPPMPNVPMPVVALVQVTVPVSKNVLKGQMIAFLGDPQALHHVELFDGIADAFEKCFLIWQVATMVTNVLGTGPVPTFAPPFVPVGPVVRGVGNMLPGGFA